MNKVFEVNSSSSRSKGQIIQELEGALNSHHVSNNAGASVKPSNSVNNLSSLIKKMPITNNTNFKLDKFFKSSNFENKSGDNEIIATKQLPAKKRNSIQNMRDSLEVPGKNRNKKRKNSLRRETIHNLTNKINFNLKRLSKDAESEDEKNSNGTNDIEEIDIENEEDSDFDADDFFKKEKNKNHKVSNSKAKSNKENSNENNSVSIIF